MELQYLLFVLLGFIASSVSAVFGFGTALIVLALGSHLIPIKDAIALSTVLFTASTAIKTVLYLKHIDWKVAGVIAITSLPFAYLGASLMAYIPAEILRRFLGVMILVYLLLSIFNLFPIFKIGTKALMAGSAVYGFFSGLLGSGNLIKVIIFREMHITKEAFVGVMAATSVLSNVAKITAYTQSGYLNASMFWPVIGLIAGAVSAALIGKRILGVVSVKHFESGVQAVLAVSAIALLI